MKKGKGKSGACLQNLQFLATKIFLDKFGSPLSQEREYNFSDHKEGFLAAPSNYEFTQEGEGDINPSDYQEDFKTHRSGLDSAAQNPQQEPTLMS